MTTRAQKNERIKKAIIRRESELVTELKQLSQTISGGDGLHIDNYEKNFTVASVDFNLVNSHTHERDCDLRLAMFSTQICPDLYGGMEGTLTFNSHKCTTWVLSDTPHTFRNPISGYEGKVDGKVAMLCFALYWIDYICSSRTVDDDSFNRMVDARDSLIQLLSSNYPEIYRKFIN